MENTKSKFKCLSGYLKPYKATIIILFVAFVLQQLCALFLPGLMSDIVDVGIRGGGIEKPYPEVASQKVYEAFKFFMTKAEKDVLSNNYVLVNSSNLHNFEDLINKNKIASEVFLSENGASRDTDKIPPDGLYVLKRGDSEGQISSLEKCFSNSSMRLAKYVKRQNVNLGVNANPKSSMLDDSQIFETFPSLESIPETTLSELDNTELKDFDAHAVTAQIIAQMYGKLGVNTSKIQMRYILKIGLFMILITAISLIFVIIENYYSAKMSAGISLKLRGDIFRKVQSFSEKEFDEIPVSSLITRTTSDVSAVKSSIITGINFVTPPIMFVGGLVMAIQKSFSMSWTILLEAFIASVIVICVFVAIFPKVYIMQELIDKFNLIIRERLSGIMVIRSFGNLKREEKRFDEINLRLSSISQFVNRSVMLMTPFLTVAMNLINVIIIWLGAKEIAQFRMQVGDLMAFTQYSAMVIGAFLMLVIIFSSLPEMAVSVSRVLEILQKEPSVKDPENPKKFSDDFKGKIEFKNVSFSYGDNENCALKNINLEIAPGEVVGIIGATGAGKSTLVKLIPRFYEISQGEILIDDLNIKSVTQDDLREKISYVSQKSTLFSGDIIYNLKYANENASEEEIKSCAQMSEILEVVQDESGNIKKEISQEGKNLSAGQRQRICIARALLKKSPICIFDDSFSSLDFKTEVLVRQKILKYLDGCSVIIVSQRLGAIIGADKIIVLEHGQIVSQGSHELLLRESDTYRQIVKSQMPQEGTA